MKNADRQRPANQFLRHMEISRLRLLARESGFSLIEMVVAIMIFGVLMAGVFQAHLSQVGHTTREFRAAESDVELGIAKHIIEQDLLMSGFGLGDDYAGTGFNPRTTIFTNSDVAPDELRIMGTALGLESRASQGWSYMASVAPTFRDWMDPADATEDDPREALSAGDRVIMLAPDTKELLIQDVAGAARWLFRYNGPGANLTTLDGTATPYDNPDIGNIIYGLYRENDLGDYATIGAKDAAARAYYTTRYYLGGAPPANCAPGTSNLLRGEGVDSETPDGTAQPLLSCVLDFQVALGIDSNENGVIEAGEWDSDGVLPGDYSQRNLSKYLKQFKLYILVQNGVRDRNYTYPQATVRVGEGAAIGRDVDLTAAQRQYRWNLVTLSVVPRNAR